MTESEAVRSEADRSHVARRYTSAHERRAQLLQSVQEQGYCTITELSESLLVSDMTIRRDIQRLVRDGHLRSVHGGVTALPQAALQGRHFHARAATMSAAKRVIAERAAQLVPDRSAIAVDAGSTTLELVHALAPDLHLKVVTQSLPVVNALLDRESVEVISLGGTLHHDTHSFAGPATLAAIAELRVNTLFLAASGINERGVYCGNDFDAVTKRALVNIADEVVLLTDSSKFDISAMVRACTLDALDRIVIDNAISTAQHQVLRQHNVEVIVVDVPGNGDAPTGP